MRLDEIAPKQQELELSSTRSMEELEALESKLNDAYEVDEPGNVQLYDTFTLSSNPNVQAMFQVENTTDFEDGKRQLVASLKSKGFDPLMVKVEVDDGTLSSPVQVGFEHEYWAEI